MSAISPVPWRPSVRAIAIAVPVERVADGADVGEAAVAQHALVGRLAEHGEALGQQVDGGVVEVVGVQVGDEHRVEPARGHLRGLGQLHQRVAPVLAVLGTGSRAPAGSSIGSTSTRRPPRLDEQRRVPDQPELHH